MELLGDAAHAPGPAAEGALAQLGACAEHRFGQVEQAANHAHAIANECTVSRRMDVCFDDRAVDTQLATARDLELGRQFDHAVIDLLQRVRPNEFGPADQRGIVGHSLEVDTAELAQH